uniref:Ig-like domain-containing protein n=1 Tax=Oncorhynchus kisutch TaxID=8019 RepID=A0A8C7JEF9_ONCKI
MEKEKWIGGSQKAGDDNRRTPPEQGEAPTSAEVVTIGNTFTDIKIFLSGSASRNPTVVPQPVSESIQQGESVTLNCKKHTETCAGEHSVYWFRHGSGESRTVRGALRLGLLHRAVSRTSPRGTSASLMLGLTTVLWPHVGRYCLGTGPSWTSRAGPVSQTRGPAVSSLDAGAEDADGLHYVVLNLSNKKNRSRRQRSNMLDEMVYSGIRQ